MKPNHIVSMSRPNINDADVRAFLRFARILKIADERTLREFADTVIEKLDAPPEWTLDLSVAKTSSDLEKTLAGFPNYGSREAVVSLVVAAVFTFAEEREYASEETAFLLWTAAGTLQQIGADAPELGTPDDLFHVNRMAQEAGGPAWTEYARDGERYLESLRQENAQDAWEVAVQVLSGATIQAWLDCDARPTPFRPI